MNGYLEKLGSGLFGSYQKRYFRMDNFNLVYFEKESDAADGAKDVIDLHTVLHTGSGEKNKGEAAPGSTCVLYYDTRFFVGVVFYLCFCLPVPFG
jgi:hypothetical protein